MKPQEIVSVLVNGKPEDDKKGNVLVMYPELEEFFNKGMYVEKITQTRITEDKCLITLIFRHYNSSQSKVN